MRAHETDCEEERRVFLSGKKLDCLGCRFAVGMNEVVAFGDIVFERVTAAIIALPR